MIIYRLIGRTAPFDWAEMAVDKELGLFQTLAGAERKRDLLKSDKSWRMEYSGFRIIQEVVLP